MSVDTANAQEAYDTIDRYLRNNLDDYLYADYSAALELISTTPEGFVLVPIEPTDEMCEAAWESEGTDYVGEHLRIWQIAPAYRAMIAAAQPKEPT